MNTRLRYDKNNEIEVNFLYESFKFEMTESGSTQPLPGLRVFLENLTVVYPETKRVRKCRNGKWLTLYRGIALEPLQPISNTSQFKDILSYLPQTFTVKRVTDSVIECSTESGCLSNGNAVLKRVTFYDNGTWDLAVFVKTVNLSSVQVKNTFTFDEFSVRNICSIVEKLHICGGIVIKKSIIMSRFHTLEQFQSVNTADPKKTLRSVSCNGIAPKNKCNTCRRMTFTYPDMDSSKENAVDKDDDMSVRIKHLLKHANPELVSLFLEQSKNVSRDPRGRRWSKSFIGTCLQLYNRSPHSYQILVSSKILVLPAASTLIMYKNRLKQEPGFDQSMFEWMLHEAKRKNLPDEGMTGGLIFDEMAIQSDLQISKNGDVVELVGFTDLGEEGDMCNSLRKGTGNRKLGTHVLQLLFLGITGFRFPFAHFVTDNVVASELYGLFWKAVQYLKTYGFKVLYTCMDGAVCNRSFMHICVGENSYLNYKFLSPNPTSSQDVIFTMDVSHVLKKIRNNIMKSGITAKSTRHLTLPDDYNIQWQMFIDCYKWDQQNSLQLHRKLTNEHIFPDSQQKMRNHLAEEVLNSEMLNLMKQYKNSLGEKGQILNGVLQLLENTAHIVSIFRDMRPVATLNDPRLNTLHAVSEWFLEWERYVHEKRTKTEKPNLKMLMSLECHEDIQACIQGFILLCQFVLNMSTTVHVTPALINSDVIENVFNQQRSTYNGANTNPNALQYRKSINSILVGQNVISRKSNAGKPIPSAVPFTVNMKPLARKRKPASTKCSSDIKVIRL